MMNTIIHDLPIITDMPTLSSKRQITLPKALCDSAGIRPGDQFRIFEHNGQITLLKQCADAEAGILRHLKAREEISESVSRDEVIERRRK